MPRLSIEARRRIVSLVSGGFTVPSIAQRLEEEKVVVSKRAVYDLVKKFRLKGVIKDLPRRRKARILTEEMKLFIEEELKNDELTSTAINASLIRKWLDLKVSPSTIKRVRQEMGWVCTRPHYCQLLREVCAVTKQYILLSPHHIDFLIGNNYTLSNYLNQYYACLHMCLRTYVQCKDLFFMFIYVHA